MADPTTTDGRPTLGASSTPVTIMNDSLPVNLVVGDTIEIGTPTAVTVPVQFIKTVAAAGTPEALTAVATYFQTAMIGGLKAARTNNVGTSYLGIGVTNDTQPLAITAGEWITINAPVGQKYNFQNFGLDVLNAGDGVAVIYS